MERPDSYTLAEISLWAESQQVSLPTVQRGFVWKPNQIENLWDSLLRGYPVGSFVLSHSYSSSGANKPLGLLDGQQRATAICLGFGTQAFRQSADQAKVFIDLESPKRNDNRKYLFRAITKSHPWGYQAVDNSKPLDANNIRKAMAHYGVRDHLDEPLEKFFPYDAVFPLPFDIFLKCALLDKDKEALDKTLRKWEHWNSIRKHDGEKRIPLTEEEISGKIARIYADVSLMLHRRKIPALYLDFNAMLAEEEGHSSEQLVVADSNVSDAAVDEPKDDEIETLFVRLNAGGTPLRGEELNYSILKANIGSDLQKVIENACDGLFVPSRFITLAYRLFQVCGGTGTRDAISMKIKPKQFQKTMTEKKDSFAAFLIGLIEEKKFEGCTLLEYAKKILKFHDELNLRGLPHLVVGGLSSSAPEVMFMLLYRLVKQGDRFPLTQEPNYRHRRMLGMITLFAWLGKGERLRNHAKLLSNVWPAIDQKTDQFWSSATVQRAMLDGVLPQLPKFDKLKNAIEGVRQNSDIWSWFEKYWGASSFVFETIFSNRDLVLYAQRQALFEWFEDRQYHLDDTNVPFDWDHIFPHKYVKGKKNIPRILRDIYNTNGNFRAWPYPLNRGDQDVLPSVKLNPNKENTQDKENTQEYEKMVKSWQEYFKSKPRIKADIKNLPKHLQEWSRCDVKWIDTKITDVKKHFKLVYQLIINRNVELCREWYEELMIDDLIPTENGTSFFETFLNNTKWRKMPEEEAKELFGDEDENNYRVSSPFEAVKAKLSFFLYCPSSKGEDMAENLKEDAIFFGVIGEDGTIRANLLVPPHSEKEYPVVEERVLGNYFTLLSNQEQHFLFLFSQFHDWLNSLSNGLGGHFLDCLKKQYREKVLL